MCIEKGQEGCMVICGDPYIVVAQKCTSIQRH